MPDLEEMSRVLYSHRWDSIEDWVKSVGQLAELTDHEIHELTHLGSNGHRRRERSEPTAFVAAAAAS